MKTREHLPQQKIVVPLMVNSKIEVYISVPPASKIWYTDADHVFPLLVDATLHPTSSYKNVCSIYEYIDLTPGQSRNFEICPNHLPTMNFHY